MSSAHWHQAALLTLVLLLLSGCGDGKARIDGTVTLDGQPVESGSITFAGDGIREGAVITKGRFQTAVPPGPYKLELNGRKVTGTRTQKGFDGKDEVVELSDELFPAKFNAQTELKEDIKPGSHSLKLELKSR